MLHLNLAFITVACLALCQCAGLGSSGSPNMGGPTEEERAIAIANEPKGDFYYGRRYYVEKTRFWGYLREPGQSANKSKLAIFRESRVKNPDRLPEDGPPGQRYGFDTNYEYRIHGNYTGEKAYDPNSDQILPVFAPTHFELVNREPGWLFSPKDHYHPQRFTLWVH
jgi:hypothetical protein